MNQAQRKYALERLDGHYKEAKAALTSRFTTPAVELSRDQKLDAIMKGAVKLKSREKLERWPSILTAYDFSALESPRTLDSKAYDAALAPIKEAYDHARDELMLGDQAVALELIRNFETLIKEKGQ